jgi:hypothetical protein
VGALADVLVQLPELENLLLGGNDLDDQAFGLLGSQVRSSFDHAMLYYALKFSFAWNAGGAFKHGLCWYECASCVDGRAAHFIEK